MLFSRHVCVQVKNLKMFTHSIFDMKSIVLIFWLSLCAASAKENIETLDCGDFQRLLVGNIIKILANKVEIDKQTNFLIATRKYTNAIDIGHNDWSTLFKSGFDPTKKTYIITHGFLSGTHELWIRDLTNALLKAVDVNVILVNWENRSNGWNYVDAVRATLMVKDDITRFLQELKNQISQRKKVTKVLWNKLYLIGHSLGAQVSGQVAHLLKKDKFFKVERITGLDPAQPCFRKCDLDFRLDKEDADFVDVIHTQTGNSNSTDGFGLRMPAGHIDFYINGGITQPKCVNSGSNEIFSTNIIGHKVACEYFIESVDISRTREGKFIGHKWDFTSGNALSILEKINGKANCSECVEMGYNTKKSYASGIYIVFTGSKQPYYEYKSDIPIIKNCLKKLDKSTKLEQDVREKVFDSPFEK